MSLPARPTEAPPRRPTPGPPAGSGAWGRGARGAAFCAAFTLAAALTSGVQAPRPSKSAGKLPPLAGIALATLAYADDLVERAPFDNRGWRRLKEGESLRTGDRIRVGSGALARFEFPWMSLTAGPSTTLRIPAERILSTVLDEGRAEMLAPGQQIVKVRTGHVEVRGEGRVVVRRQPRLTQVLVMAMEGTFRVEAAGKTTTLRTGQGTAIEDGKPPGPALKLPTAPGGLWPGADPVYVKKGEDVRLRWSPEGDAHHVQILPIDSSHVLIARDVGAAPQVLAIPWLGTYRWRVSTRDATGLEGVPSAFGYICVVDR